MLRLPTLLLLASLAAARQDDPAPGSREATWPAPTAEDWARPCPIQWERTWEDALGVAEETGKALLICVNMDGEIASEHYAGIRYRQPEIAALYEPYVCVIASVYRHNPRDHDHEGNRILCPRFGHVTCGEHIAIEPILYGEYFEGTRVAPRHIMVELDRAEQYDVYYALDTASVFERIRTGVEGRENPIPPIVREDRSIDERVDSTANVDRQAVEQAYRAGDSELRRRLLRKALAAGDRASVDLLRLAIFGFDVELAKLGREGLVLSKSQGAIDLIGEALRVPLPAQEREELIAALERLGEQFPRARTLARVHRGLGARSDAVDVEGWSRALAAQEGPHEPVERAALESAADYSTQVAASRPRDAQAQLELAEATLAIAVDPRTANGFRLDRRTADRYGELLFEDARAAALEAQRLGATGWRLDAALGLCAWYLGDGEEGYARAQAAVQALPSGEQGWNAMAVLSLFADQRRRDITRALRAREEWPAEWLTDLHAAYLVLARHPLGTDAQVVDPIDFLNYMGAFTPASQLLDLGLVRFPDSPLLHDRLRGRILREHGVAGLEPAYERMLALPGASPNLPWFAGYTSIVAAEFHRRASDPSAAAASYDRAVALFERAVASNEATRDSADHYVALALAGKARLALEGGDLDAALEGVLASFARGPDAASSLDGLNITPVGTARMLLSRLQAEESSDAAARVQAALDALDPRHLELPAFERQPDPRRRGRRGGRDR